MVQREEVIKVTSEKEPDVKQWRLFVLVVLLMSSELLLGTVDAVDRTRPVRIGVLTESWGPPPHLVGLRDGLLELGYREDKDFVIGIRFTQGNIAALSLAAQELVQYEVDIVFAAGDNEAKAAQKATARLPIVFVSSSSPVELGLIESFARPGGNLTGVTDLHVELAPKRLQVFQEMIPNLKRVLFLYNPVVSDSAESTEGYHDAARYLGIELIAKPVRTEVEARTALSQAKRGEMDGLLAPFSISH